MAVVKGVFGAKGRGYGVLQGPGIVLNGCLHWDYQEHQSQRHFVCSQQRWQPGLSAGTTSALSCAVRCGLCVWLHIKVRHPHTQQPWWSSNVCDADLSHPCRLEDAANCSLLFETVLDVLRGTNYPQYVASFGNSPLEYPLDWVPIKTNFNPRVSVARKLNLRSNPESKLLWCQQ